MTTAIPKMTISEMGETMSIVRQVDMWGDGGDMRSIAGGDPSPPGSHLERAAILAFDVLRLDEGDRRDRGEGRANLLDLMSNGLRMAIVDERENGGDGRSDVDRARLIAVSMAVVLAARDQADGQEPSELQNPSLEAMRRKSGLEASSLNREDAYAVAVGMTDMVAHPEAVRQVQEAMRRSMTPSAAEDFEGRLLMADATWPKVEARDAGRVASAAKGFTDASMPLAAVQREAVDRASKSR